MWAKSIDQHASKNVKRILVGNKCDLVDRRQVSTEKGRELANEFGIQFFETSAKNATSVEEAFLTLARDVQKRVACCNDCRPDDIDHKEKVVILEHANEGGAKIKCPC